MKELYIIDSSYNPIAASNNRLFAYADFFTRHEVNVSFFYLFPYGDYIKCEQYRDKFNFVYLWEDSPFKNKYLTTLRSIFKMRKLLRPDVPVYIYGMLNCVPFLVKTGIRIYHEYTENPEVVGVIPNLIGRFLNRLYKQSLKSVRGLFVITDILRNYYIKTYGVDPHRIEVVNMMVDQHRFDDYEDVRPAQVISYCGTVSEFKDGVSCLVLAFAKLNIKHSGYRLRIIGNFENAETEIKLKSLVNELNIEQQVDFTGPVMASKMPLLLRSSSILALARPDNIQSKYGFATKIGEYLVSERPVVLTKVGAVEEFLTDGVDCILAQPDSVDSFAEKLSWVIDNPEKAASIGREGKQTALRCFNAKTESEKVYKRIAGEI